MYRVFNHSTCLILLISRRRFGLAHFTLHAAKQRVAIAYVAHERAEFLSVRSRQMLYFSQRSKPSELIFNTKFYDSVCFQFHRPHG